MGFDPVGRERDSSSGVIDRSVEYGFEDGVGVERRCKVIVEPCFVGIGSIDNPLIKVCNS